MNNRGSDHPQHHILTGQTERIASVSPAVSVRILSKFLVFATFILIIAGSLVTSTKSALADPGWPLFLGQWYPQHFEGGLAYVYTHRLIVVAVTTLTLLVAILVQLKDPRGFMKKLGWSAFSLIILQALFGALVLKTIANPFVSMGHGIVAQAFLCVTIALAVFSSRTWFSDLSAPVVQRIENRGYIGFMKFAVVVLFLQVVLGGGVRHSSGSTDMFFPFIIAHIAGAFTVIFTVIWYFMRTWQVYRDVAPMRRTAKFAAGLVCYQIFFGILAIFSNRARLQPEMAELHHVAFSTAHIIGGTSLLTLMFASFLRAHRLLDLTQYSPAPGQAYQSQEVNV